MTKPVFIEITWTTGSLDEARKVARALVQKRLVACAQIIPWVESIYIWDMQLETTQESKVVFKSTESLFATIAKEIEENATYDIPEVTYRIIDGGNEAYMNWVEEQVEASVTEGNMW